VRGAAMERPARRLADGIGFGFDDADADRPGRAVVDEALADQGAGQVIRPDMLGWPMFGEQIG
jgi:hypothetical protein